jgi:hypothetical protein
MIEEDTRMEACKNRFKRNALTVATMLAALGAGGAAAAPVQWGGNGHWYEFIAAPSITWGDADSAATGLGAGWNLASITSAAEETFIISLITGTIAERTHVWIGGTDAATEGTWTWTNGDPFSYTNWWGGEPNNSGNEDYLALDFRVSAWAWNDAPTNVFTQVPVAGYIVENPVPVPAAVWLLASALLGVAGIARRRRT